MKDTNADKTKPEKKLPIAAKIIAGAGIVIGAVAMLAIKVISSSTAQTKNDDETDEDFSPKNDICDESADYICEYPARPKKKEYTGYVPVGCSACGGPYPLCRMGCPVYDDD